MAPHQTKMTFGIVPLGRLLLVWFHLLKCMKCLLCARHCPCLYYRRLSVRTGEEDKQRAAGLGQTLVFLSCLPL